MADKPLGTQSRHEWIVILFVVLSFVCFLFATQNPFPDHF
jgi:hypothetical protein